jgi:multiple sugar transport system permease protein
LGTLLFSLTVGIAFALQLNQDLRFRAFYRTVLTIPWVVSQLTAGLLWVWVLDPRFSPYSSMLGTIGIKLAPLLTDPHRAMPTLIQANTWRTYPLVMVLVLAGLQAIPRELFESARIDGATNYQMLQSITLPLLRTTLLVAIVLTTIYSFELVTLVFIMTGGGPAGATDVLALQVFKETLRFYRIGIASAEAVVILLVNAAFAIVYIRTLRIEREQ